MPAPDHLCLECGHDYAWHVRERATRRLGADPGMERSCYRQISGRDCPCAEFRDSRQRLVTAPATGGRVLKNGVLTLLLVVLGLALLYSYRAQTPAIPTVAISEAIRAVNAGEVKAVTIVANKATLDLTDGARKQAILPEGSHGDDPLTEAIKSYNQANPTRAIQLRYENTEATFSVIGSVLLSLLPVLLIGGFLYYMMNTMRSRRDD